eukprot:CAMPEP_0201663028 /NCGR_PEP_ID=MMETSP0494-20130426/4949_1 /ASSEMBLY_ACC=CAM_ASM_000839 /TAXON_ID=420259 /ORGANISM="Thalassiosira gravida, Strain GMp14c1" /LENGTH=191 /DNA_ID=CAMNT_0048141525 /DNA_START=211 /DNA_END=786 /DNA_ORIENTATION=+
MTFTVSCSRIISVNLIAWLLASSCTLHSTAAFTPSPSRISSLSNHAIHTTHRRHNRASSTIKLQSTSSNNNDDGDDGDSNNDREDSSRRVPNDLGLEIIRVNDSSEISDGAWNNIEGGAPTRWMVMKNLLGVNIFTYILAGCIVFFISMNLIFGPGWLGQSLGWEDVGTFTKTSDSLPLNVDVSAPEYLLQ